MWTTDPDELAAAPGTYILLLQLRAPTALPQRFGGTLPGGIYGYVGSARGPGGLRTRGRRHLRREKSLRWHIDWLSAYAEEGWSQPFLTLNPVPKSVIFWTDSSRAERPCRSGVSAAVIAVAARVISQRSRCRGRRRHAPDC